MAWITRGLFLFSFGLFLWPVRSSAEQPQSSSGFRRLYVVQPGPGPGPHTYNVGLTTSFGSQVRTRRMGNQAASAPQFSQQQPVVRVSGQEQSQQEQLMKLSGVNVCGGQCCHGWSKAQGSQRCTKQSLVPRSGKVKMNP